MAHEILWALIFAVVAAPIGHWVVTNRNLIRLRALGWTILRSQRVRVSCSVLLRISDGHKYLLARMFRRQDAFGPFGGTYKYSSAAQVDLDRVGFSPQALESPTRHDIQNDLRGFVPGPKIPHFLEWLEKRIHVESDAECLRRELREELREVGLNDLSSAVDGIRFRFAAQLIEGPDLVAGVGAWQMRVFKIYDLDLSDPQTQSFRSRLIQAAQVNDHLLWASGSEVRVGRALGRTIGHHSGYLYSKKRVRPDLPPFGS